METHPHPFITLSRHERAVAILERLIADKRQAEEEIVDNFHTDPLIQAAVAELKRRRDERGTAAI
ncbi:hypothetical protein [Spirosoma utsteinense]|uniref:Uncharacterized protein n=1 Tax=Spirosoma utsteinense TaxID=2585773 RepID=A0ABR6W4W5_9BACT|nr:hypothetical protein [Spirosoma utsteinense]MBC3785343.1 hypothetical protein [Spirosoma utsteinense]MBC3791630.1 hypothetical protein [Spirosoma utsteinense]